MNQNITPEQALQILSDALQPNMANQITRAGYIAIDKAIATIAELIKPATQTEESRDA